MQCAIQFVYPEDTHAISLSGKACSLSCDHCNKHYIEQMPTLQDEIPKNTKSFLISGGLKPDGTSFLLDRKKELTALKASGKYHFNSHVGFVDEEELEEIAKIVDFVSFDFVSDPEVIRKVYHLNRSKEEYIRLYKLLESKIQVHPHVTIGLDAGKIHWEYEAIQILHDLGAKKLVLNVLIPTAGTKFANVSNPDLKEVRKVFQYARDIFSDGMLILGCMRPAGKYRMELDMIAIEEGVDRIVQPTIKSRKFAEKMGMDISYLYECCVMDPKKESRHTKERELVRE
ncbi:radical SAM protein [Candidatus Peregrinibacteria bacterium]|nr:radical SAM protein [Candidatus Peregrinibacteria bacterium]